MESFPVLVKYIALFAGLVVLLAFGVRPALRRAAQPERAIGAKMSSPKELKLEVAAPPVLKPLEAAQLDVERQRNQEIFEHVTSHLKREPSQSSRLLQSWIHSD
jgi:flagellar M-ring protein FliF